MNIGDKVRIRPSAEGHIYAWWGLVSYSKVEGKIGEYIGHGERMNLPVIDFGNIGPLQFTCNIPEEHLIPE